MAGGFRADFAQAVNDIQDVEGPAASLSADCGMRNVGLGGFKSSSVRDVASNSDGAAGGGGKGCWARYKVQSRRKGEDGKEQVLLRFTMLPTTRLQIKEIVDLEEELAGVKS